MGRLWACGRKKKVRAKAQAQESTSEDPLKKPPAPAVGGVPKRRAEGQGGPRACPRCCPPWAPTLADRDEGSGALVETLQGADCCPKLLLLCQELTDFP